MLWAITAYFNPAGYANRLRNYRTFRERLEAPLIAVECSFGRDFELRRGDADILVQISGGDVMWQKERLLNVALCSLPPECTAVAWLDCDIVFQDPRWSDHAVAALEAAAIVHLYRERYHPSKDTSPTEFNTASMTPTAESTVHLIRSGRCTPDLLRHAGLASGWTNGLAWAGRRDLVEKHGLYDACILGSGDRAILGGAYGCFDDVRCGLQMNAARFDHYLSWARPFHADASGRVAGIEGAVFHLWHGELADRRHSTRHADMKKLGFDPSTDLTRNGGGAWRWNSNKPALHAHVRDYFRSRKEDGEPTA